MNKHSMRLGLMAMSVTILSWAGMFPVGKIMLATLDPYAITSIRYGCGAVILLAILWLVEGSAPFSALRSDPRRWALFFYGSMGFAGFSLFNFEGLRLTSPQQAAIIAGMQPLMIALTQWLLRGARPARATLICVVVAFSGCVVVVSKGDFSTLALSGSLGGDLLVLVAAVCWVVYTLAAARFSDWSPLRYTALSCGLGTLSILFLSAVAVAIGHAHVPSMQQVESQAWPMLFLILMTSVVAVLLWNVGVKHLGALNATLMGNFIPVVVFLIGIALGQDIAPAEFIGAGLVLAALIANNLFARRALQAGPQP
ncbi:MAG: DMT family transporter [Sterolibacterium sp.]|jgi:drug/metabolite transporter (DMT)-like permease